MSPLLYQLSYTAKPSVREPGNPLLLNATGETIKSDGIFNTTSDPRYKPSLHKRQNMAGCTNRFRSLSREFGFYPTSGARTLWICWTTVASIRFRMVVRPALRDLMKTPCTNT